MCKSQKGQASKDKRTAGGEIRDASYDGEKESADMQLEGEVSLGDLIWIKLRGNLWWPAVVVDENGVNESSKPGNRSEGKVLVRLYGSYEYLYADPVKYKSEFKIILEQNNSSCHEIFDKALEQHYSPRKSNKPRQQGSKSSANRRADASKGKKKLNQNQVNGNEIDVNNGEELSERAGETNSKVSKEKGVKRKLVSNERSTGEIADGKISKKDKKLKPGSPHAEENARRRNPRRNGSNVDDKSRSRNSKQDAIQKKHKQKSFSNDKEAKNKSRKRAHEAAKVQAGTQRALKQKSTTKGEQAKNKTHKQDEVQKKLINNKQRARDEVKCKSPKQGSVHSKLKSNSQSSERTSPGKSPESSVRRTRVMQGLGLIAPPGSPFHKNGLI